MTLSPNNIDYTFPALINLWENGYNYIHANCVYEKGWTIEHARVLYNELKKVADYLLNNHLEKIKGTSILNLDLSQQKNQIKISVAAMAICSLLIIKVIYILVCAIWKVQ